MWVFFFFFFLDAVFNNLFRWGGGSSESFFFFYFVYIAATGYPSVGHKYNILSSKAYNLNPKFHVLNMTRHNLKAF